jgi:hypothetical protein
LPRQGALAVQRVLTIQTIPQERKCRTILIPHNPSVETYVSFRTEEGQKKSGAEHKK